MNAHGRRVEDRKLGKRCARCRRRYGESPCARSHADPATGSPWCCCCEDERHGGEAARILRKAT